MNPTRAHYRHSALQRQPTLPEYVQDRSRDGTDKEKPPYNDEEYASNIEFKWRSRDNRKGRHTLLVDPSDSSGKYITPKPTTTLHAAGQGILRMVTQYPYWDVSYLVAIIFTLGSVVWVINAFFAWLPLVRPSTEFHNELLYGGGITAFIGATIFEIGSVLLMFEAVNENRAGCFGWALEKVLEGNGRRREKLRIRADKDGCSHHHTNKHNLVGKPDGRFCFTHLSSGDRTGTSRCKHIRDSPISEYKFGEFPKVHVVALNSSYVCTLESRQTLLSNDVLLRVSHVFLLKGPQSKLPPCPSIAQLTNPTQLEHLPMTPISPTPTPLGILRSRNPCIRTTTQNHGFGFLLPTICLRTIFEKLGSLHPSPSSVVPVNLPHTPCRRIPLC